MNAEGGEWSGPSSAGIIVTPTIRIPGYRSLDTRESSLANTLFDTNALLDATGFSSQEL